MPLLVPPPVLPDTAVLLVLLPVGPLGQAADAPLPSAALQTLQARLGSAVRVLKVDAATHPAVVRSFDLPTLPACVLMRQGVELWRQQGLPDDDAGIEALLTRASTR